MSDEQSERPIATVQQAEPGTAIAAVNDWDQRAAAVRTSIRCDTDDSMTRYVMALAGSDAELQGSCNAELCVTDWLLHVREAIDPDTGEVRPQLRLVLITEDGRRIAGGSRSVIDGWASIVRLFGSRPTFPRLGVTLSKVKSPNNPGHYVQIANVRVMPAKGTAKK